MKKKQLLGVAVVLSVIGFCVFAGAEVTENFAVIVSKPVILADPALANDWYDTQVVYNLYSPLIHPTPEGSIRPHLAESWDAVDGNLAHWRFTLRRGVKFHDGSEVTAEDVAFSMDRLQALGAGYSGTFGKVETATISRYEVDFILEKPNVSFLEALVLFWPLNKELVLEHIQAGDYGDLGDYGQEWLETHDAGSGPYMMTSHSPGNRMEAVRFEDYFLGWQNWCTDEVPIDKLFFLMESEPATLLMMLRNRQMELEPDNSFTRETYEDIAAGKEKGLHMFPAHAVSWTAWMNTKRPPTDDLHFRKAIQYAFDYEAIMEPYRLLGAREGGIYLSTLPGYTPVPPIPRKQDLEKAREELALSKYDPKDVTVSFHICAGLADEEEIALQLQADMAKIGVTVEIAAPPWPQFAAECDAQETSANLNLFKFPSAYPSPDFTLYYQYHPDNVGGIYATHWYTDEKLGQLIDEARATLDFNERVEIYSELQEIIGDLALSLLPYEIRMVFTAQDYLVGPRETYTMVGPTINMHNFRINLKLKEQMGK